MECPNGECGGYFKVKPGTGIKTDEMQCHYCGHKGATQVFLFTKDQEKYAMSYAKREAHKLVQGIIKDSVKGIQASLRDNDFISVLTTKRFII